MLCMVYDDEVARSDFLNPQDSKKKYGSSLFFFFTCKLIV